MSTPQTYGNNGQAPARATQLEPQNGAYQNNEGDDAQVLWARYKQIMKDDTVKFELLKDVLTRFDDLSKQCALYKKHVAESQAIESNYHAMQSTYQAMQSSMETDPFVVVLIDGDGMVFQDALIAAGETGGRKAAGLLSNAINQCIREDFLYIPTNVRIVCRVYANVRGLSDVLVRTGIASEINGFQDFTIGFNGGEALFDFIDVGPGKNHVNQKLIETFKLHINDLHCRHIFFGCGHDNGYARLLGEYMNDGMYTTKITLLGSVPFENEIMTLPFAKKKFPGLFRNSQLQTRVVPRAIPPAVPTNPCVSTPLIAKALPIIPGLPARFPPPKSRENTQSPAESLDSRPLAPKITRTPSGSTVASVDYTAKMTYANKVVAPAPAPAPVPARPQVAEPLIKEPEKPSQYQGGEVLYNRHGQRVDLPIIHYDSKDLARIRQLRLCNNHYLQGNCTYGDKCAHAHRYPATLSDILTLRLLARLIPCHYGTDCPDANCIHGHHCPIPKKPTKNAKGVLVLKGRGNVVRGKDCLHGEDCKFGEGLHHIDLEVVRGVTIR